MDKITDVSYWQQDIDWAKTAKEIKMAILRASCGTAKDGYLDANVKGCRKNGIPFGVYHFVMATNTQRARDEADRFYNSAKAHNPAFWVVDVEHPPLLYANGKSLPMRPDFYNLVKTFVSRLRQRVGDAAKIIYYGGESVYEPYGHLSQIPWDGLWIANYSTKPKMAHDLHQYTSSGRIMGISTNVDLNRLAGDKPLEWWTGVVEVNPVPDAPIDTPQIPDDPPADADREDTEPVDKDGNGQIVRVTEPYAWNVRAGDGISYDSILVAYQGYEFDYVATSVSGWLAVRLQDGRIGWISPKAVQIIDLKKAVTP